MLTKMTFVNHASEAILFGVDGIAVNENDVRDYEWNYNSQYDKITSFDRGITTRSIGVTVFGEDAIKKANSIYEKIEKDVVEMEAGKLYINVCSTSPTELKKHYYISGYFFASSKPQIVKHNIVKMELSFVSDVSFWIKESTTSFNISTSDSISGKNLDFPYDFPYDFATSLNIFQLINTNYTDTDFRMVFYGPVANPSITVNGHTYEVDVDVEENEYLMIDSLNRKITLVGEFGEETNCFNFRNRDSYIFEKIPRGTHNVSWDSDFRFDIVLIEQRSEPVWI